MDTPDIAMTVKGFGLWLAWKALYMVYLLCVALPMVLYIACLLIVAIERRSTIELPIIMTAMLHPAVAIPIGISTETIGQYLSSKIFADHADSFKIKVIRRILTYSLNVHLALIAALLFCLYTIWISLEAVSGMNFTNEPFNQCECDLLSTCTNHETENSFQNIFVGVAIQPFLIAFFVTSVTSHLVHAFILCFPPPLKLVYFFLGGNKKSPLHITDTSNENNASSNTKIYKQRFILGTVVLLFFTGMLTSPYFLFDSHLDDGIHLKTERTYV